MNKKKLIAELEGLAKEVLEIKQKSLPRRPLVIEFCGSPKSGKSSCINSLELFLRRNGFRTRLLTERASVCPITNKFDPYFNIWTVSSALAELVEVLSNSPKDYDILIMDRGIFDGLCWFNFLHERDNLDQENLSKLESFLTMSRLKGVLDLVYIFSADAKISLDREYANLLTEKTGSIMKREVLDHFKASVSRTAERYVNVYQKIEFFDTTEKSQNEVGYEVTKDVLKILQNNLEESVGYIQRSILDEDLDIKFKFNDTQLSNHTLSYASRAPIERDATKVQPIPVLIIKDTESNKVLVVRKNSKSTSKTSPEAGKDLIYLGGHIRKEDSFHSTKKDIISVAKYALAREVKEEIGIDYHPNSSQNNPLCIWIRNNERSSKHLAICFIWETKVDKLKLRIDKNEFVTPSKASKSGRFYEINELVKNKNNFEAWSRVIINNYFNEILDESQIGLDI